MQERRVSGDGLPTIILFGAFDRHNFGDLLFPHIAQALLSEHETLVAGLSARDLRQQGGHNVRSFADVVTERAGHPAVLLHVGGEVLSCSAWYAALMLLPPEQLHSTVTHFGAHPEERAQWIRKLIGTADLAPYVAPLEAAPAVSSVVLAGVGGVGLSQCEPALRDEVLAMASPSDSGAATALPSRDEAWAREGVTSPETTASPSPQEASIATWERSPVLGLSVNATPADLGSTIFCTPTDMEICR